MNINIQIRIFIYGYYEYNIKYEYYENKLIQKQMCNRQKQARFYKSKASNILRKILPFSEDKIGHKPNSGKKKQLRQAPAFPQGKSG